MLGTLPVLIADPETRGIYPIDYPGYRDEWVNGGRFAADNAGRYFDLVCLARLTTVIWSLVGGWLIYRWARELSGDAAGCLGLALWCFEPNVLAHAQVLMPDLPAAVAGLAATYAFWHYLRSPSWGRAGVAGVLLGVAQLTKFTLLVFYGVWPLLWLLHHLVRPAPAPRVRPVAQLGQGLLIFVFSLFVLNLGYEFQKTARPLGEFKFVSRTFAGGADDSPRGPGNRFEDHWLGRVVVPVPGDYLSGIDLQRRDFERLGKTAGSYLGGEWREEGWWYYYLYALAVKVPLGVIAMVLWGAALAFRRCPGGTGGALAVWLPGVAILALVSSQTGFNHHMRYVLPALPFFIVGAAGVGGFFRPVRRMRGLAAVGLITWAVGSSLAVHPHYLSYFNELGGGPGNGHEHLLDSNIDDGQDLLFLKEWLDRNPQAEPLCLAYYGAIDPRILGIDYSLPPPEPAPGYHAVSVNYLRGSMLVDAPDGRGGWARIPRNRYAYFTRFEPVAKAGYCIWIYHIPPDTAGAEEQTSG